MKSVLLSIKPKYCELIARGKKTVEVRKTKPKIETPFKVYIYETKALYKPSGDKCLYEGKGKVIGEFVCRLVVGLKANNGIQTYFNGVQGTCLTDKEMIDYAKGKMIYYWHISDLNIYDEPKELSEFYQQRSFWGRKESIDDYSMINGKLCLPMKRPPQSWCYVEELK